MLDLYYILISFTGLVLVSTIDQQYYETIKHPIKTKMEEEAEMTVPVTRYWSVYGNVESTNGGLPPKKHPCMLAVVRALTMLYECFYFHFMPYIVIIYINYHTLVSRAY